jgi:hypothetical protein
MDEDVWRRRTRLPQKAHSNLARQRIALAAVAGSARCDDVLPTGGTTLRARNDVVHRQVGACATVLTGPVVAREHGTPGDLAAVCIPRDADVGHETNHHRSSHRSRGRAKLPFRVLDDLRFFFEQQHDRPPHRADVDRLEGRVQDEHPPGGKSASLVLLRRRGPRWLAWYRGDHGGASVAGATPAAPSVNGPQTQAPQGIRVPERGRERRGEAARRTRNRPLRVTLRQRPGMSRARATLRRGRVARSEPRPRVARFHDPPGRRRTCSVPDPACAGGIQCASG